MRRVVVPISIRLDRSHAVMQATMEWTNSHLWEFRVGETGFGPKDPDGGFSDGPLDASKATLLGVLEDTGCKTLTCLYDFGDGCEHTIKVERIFDGVTGLEVPLTTRTTSATKSSPNGTTRTSIPPSSTSRTSKPNSQPSPTAGPVNPQNPKEDHQAAVNNGRLLDCYGRARSRHRRA